MPKRFMFGSVYCSVKIDSVNTISGALLGLLRITVMWSSVIGPRTEPFINILLWKFKSLCRFNFRVSMFIFFGSLTSSVQKIRLSIIFIPVIMLSTLNFKTSFLSTNIGVVVPSLWCSMIASVSLLVTNQYNTSFFSSATAPTHLKPVPTILSTLVLPNIFCTVPTSDPSDVATCTFMASLYWPLGTSLSSRSLFITPFWKLFLISGIF